MRHISAISAVVLSLTVTAAAASRGTAETAPTGIVADSVVTGVANGKLHLDMVLHLDSLDIPSNRRVIYTPVLTGIDSSEVASFTPLMVNGRRQHISYQRNRDDFDGYEIRRFNGTAQSIAYTASVDHEPWMDHAVLSLTNDFCGCGDILGRRQDELAVIDRRQTSSSLFEPLTCYMKPEAEASKDRCESGSAFVDFPVNRTEIHPGYRRNITELAKIISTVDLVKNDSNVTITGIDIHGYASPEGPYANNVRLAQGRARALADYVARLRDFETSLFSVSSTPEDWDGLRRYVTDSLSLGDTEAILAVIDDGKLTPDERDSRLRQRFPEEYAFLLANVYPALRHSDYTVRYTVRAFSLEDARRIFAEKPGQLSLEELFLVAQSYPVGSDEFNQVFDVAVHLFPNDPTANLNAAINAVNRGDIVSAERFIAKAPECEQTEEVRNAIGLLKRTDTQNINN